MKQSLGEKTTRSTPHHSAIHGVYWGKNQPSYMFTASGAKPLHLASLQVGLDEPSLEAAAVFAEEAYAPPRLHC